MIMLAQFKHFVGIIEWGSFSAAAAALNISQPGLSRSLQALESRLGVTLIERTGSPVPTEAGRLLLPRARALLAEQASINRDLDALRNGAARPTFVNVAPMVAVSLLPRILTVMARDHPEYPISVKGENGANYDWKIEALKAGDLDALLTIYDPSICDESLVQTLLFQPSLRVVVRRGHPAVGSGAAGLADLMGYRWILPPEGSSPRRVVENEFALQGLRPPADAVEISDWRIAFDLVGASEMVTAIPYHPACFQDELRRFSVLPISFSAPPLAIAIIVRSISARRSGTLAFMRVAQNLVQGLAQQGFDVR